MIKKIKRKGTFLGSDHLGAWIILFVFLFVAGGLIYGFGGKILDYLKALPYSGGEIEDKVLNDSLEDFISSYQDLSLIVVEVNFTEKDWFGHNDMISYIWKKDVEDGGWFVRDENKFLRVANDDEVSSKYKMKPVARLIFGEGLKFIIEDAIQGSALYDDALKVVSKIYVKDNCGVGSKVIYEGTKENGGQVESSEEQERMRQKIANAYISALKGELDGLEYVRDGKEQGIESFKSPRLKITYYQDYVLKGVKSIGSESIDISRAYDIEYGEFVTVCGGEEKGWLIEGKRADNLIFEDGYPSQYLMNKETQDDFEKGLDKILSNWEEHDGFGAYERGYPRSFIDLEKNLDVSFRVWIVDKDGKFIKDITDEVKSVEILRKEGIFRVIKGNYIGV